MFPPPPTRSQYSVLIRAKVTELVKRVLVLYPFLVSRVDLPGLAAASSKQASKQQHARNGQKSELHCDASDSGKIVVMIPMHVKYNHTKFEQETQRWRPGTGFASGGPKFQKPQFRAKNSRFWAQKALEHIQNGQSKGNGGYTARAA